MSSSEASNALISPSVCVCGLPLDMLSVQVQATTGNVYYLRVAHSDTIDYIRRIIAKKTKLSKERILLLYKDRQLRDGSLEEHNVRDGSKLHLVPSVETGLLSQRPEQSVMQALESLNDGQVTDFLSGKAPLNLTMRLGDHMMLIQLQLSTVSPVQHHGSSSNNSSSSSNSSRGGSSHHFTTLRRGYSSSSSHSSSASSCTSVQTQHNNSSQLQQQNHQASPQKSILSTPPTSTSSTSAQSSRHSASRHHQHHHHHHHHHHHRNANSNGTSGGAARHHHHHHGHHYHHSHPYYHNPYPQYQLLPQPHSANSAVLQSKSTTQSQPINLQQQQLQQQQHHQKTSPPAHQNPSAISSSKNSNVLVTSSCNSSTVSSHPIYSTPPRRSSSANNYSSSNFSSPTSSLSSLSPSSPTTPWSPASFTPPPTSSLHSSNYYSNNSSNIAYTPTSSSFSNQHPQQHMTGKSSNSTTSELPIRVCPHTSVDDLDLSDLGLRSSSMGEDLSFSTRRPMAPSSVGGRVRGVSAVGLDTRALAEASRNLTQTLRQLSSEVLTNKPSAGGHQGGSVAAPHKKQTSSCNYSGSQRSNGASNTAPVQDVEPSKLVSSIAAESNNLSMASESSSLKAFKSSRSGRTASSVRPNGTNSDQPPVRSTTHEVSGAAVPGAGVAGGESPAAAHSFGDVKRGNSCSPPHQPQGAIIESMQHHGKGVFSGTFSGTLNPALQDRQGRPKRDISTIIHILNDLLCATPHYTNTAAAVAAVAAATSSKSTAPTSAASASPPRSPTGEPKESVSAEDAATRSRVQHIQAMLEQRAERRRARRLARTAGSGQPYSLPGANLPKSKHQQSSSKPETQPTKNSTLKCPSGEASFVSGKKPLSEMASVLYAKGIESKIDASPNSDMVANADTSLSSKQQQQQHHQHQHLMRELLKGCVAASTDSSSARQLNSSGPPQNFPDCESECKQQLENNYSGAAHLQQQQIHHSGDVATLAVPTEPPTAMEVADVQVESQTAESSSMDVDTTIESTTVIDSNQAPTDEEHVPLKLPQDQQEQQDSVQQRSQQPQQDQQPQQPQQQKQQSSQQQEASGDAEQQDTAKIVSLNSGTVMA